MQFFFEVLIGGLLSGVMYSLVALGFVLIYKASGVFNFAQATIGLSFLLEGVAQIVWGSTVRGLDIGIQDEPIQWISDQLGLNVSKFDLAAAAIAAVLVAVLAQFFSRTRSPRCAAAG